MLCLPPICSRTSHSSTAFARHGSGFRHRVESTLQRSDKHSHGCSLLGVCSWLMTQSFHRRLLERVQRATAETQRQLTANSLAAVQAMTVPMMACEEQPSRSIMLHEWGGSWLHAQP